MPYNQFVSCLPNGYCDYCVFSLNAQQEQMFVKDLQCAPLTDPSAQLFLFLVSSKSMEQHGTLKNAWGDVSEVSDGSARCLHRGLERPSSSGDPNADITSEGLFPGIRSCSIRLRILWERHRLAHSSSLCRHCWRIQTQDSTPARHPKLAFAWSCWRTALDAWYCVVHACACLDWEWLIKMLWLCDGQPKFRYFRLSLPCSFSATISTLGQLFTVASCFLALDDGCRQSVGPFRCP